MQTNHRIPTTHRSSIIAVAIAALFLVLTLSGCLVADRKVIVYRLNQDGSGSGTIVYSNLQSLQESDEEQSLQDYTTLISEWLNGTKFEDENPTFTNVRKKLIEIGSTLHGQITFDFPNYIDVDLFRYSDQGPWMYYALLNTSTIELYDSTNGDYGGDRMPVIFWPQSTNEFRIWNTFDIADRQTTSLLPLYRKLGTAGVGVTRE